MSIICPVIFPFCEIRGNRYSWRQAFPTVREFLNMMTVLSMICGKHSHDQYKVKGKVYICAEWFIRLELIAIFRR